MVADRRMRLMVAVASAALAVGMMGMAWPASGGAAEPVDHRLLTSQKRLPAGMARELGRLAVTRPAYRQMWDHFRLRGERPGVNWSRKRVLFVTTGEPSICPLRFRTLRLNDESKTFRLKARSNRGECTDDWTPRTFVVAVARDSIPKGKLSARVNWDRRVQVRRVR